MKIPPLVIILGGVALAAAAVALPMALRAPPETPAGAPAAAAAKPLSGEATALPPDHPPIPGQLPADHPPMGGATAQAQGAQIHGTVLEVLDVNSYTYLRLSTTTEGELWAAVQKSKVAVGQEVDLVGASRMDGFTSPSLGRTFDKIVFANLR